MPQHPAPPGPSSSGPASPGRAPSEPAPPGAAPSHAGGLAPGGGSADVSAEELTSRLEIRVRFCETDLMGIVHHANYLTYFEAGRVDWLHKRGVSYEAWARHGVHLPVVETRLRYRKAARFDDVLVVETTSAVVTRVTVRFDYRIVRGADLLCEGETLLACVGHDLAPKRMPELVRQVLRSPPA